MAIRPGYLSLLDSGALEKRASHAHKHLSICDVCALKCPVDRLAGGFGACRTGEFAKVSSYGPHFGEEKPLSGWHGSGTIFFTRCNLRCQYCQNHDISQTDSGFQVEAEDLAVIMLELQSYGCHNINLVSPSHVVPQIIAAVFIAADAGLNIPLVYNTGGYDSMAMLTLLDGIIDIYMPDMKYADSKIAHKYSKIPNYPSVNQNIIKEMHRQVGDLSIDEHGIAQRGLLVRHLILPNNLAGTETILRFIAEEISTNTYINLMDQYRPTYKAHRFPEIDRSITTTEFNDVLRFAKSNRLTRLDKKELSWLSYFKKQ
jgi:putative pyruvate formate lyase activating enzyme